MVLYAIKGNLVTQRIKKQLVVAWSSAEVVFQAMVSRVCELTMVKNGAYRSAKFKIL